MSSWSFADLAAAVAPAVWVTAVAVAALVALARWYDPVPGRITVVCGLAVALLYGEVLVGGSLLLPLDNLRGHVPFRELAPAEPHGNLLQGDLIYLVHPARREVRRAAAAGEWPLTSPRIGAGLPLLADPQSQALQPVTAFGEGPLPALRAPAGVAALRTFLAMVFAFLLLRRLGAGRGPALAGGLAFGLGGFLQLWIGWPLASSAALLPAALYALVLTDERGFRRDRALLVVTLAALLLAGHPETVLYALGTVGIFAGVRLVGREPGRRLAWAGATLAALALAAALAAPALLPFGELLPHTLRWERVTGTGGANPEAVPTETLATRNLESRDASPPAPATRLVQAAAPNALGNGRFVHYWGLRNTNEDAAGFVGTAVLVAALLSLPGWLAGRRPLRHELLGLCLATAAGTWLALPGGFAGLVPEPGASGRVALVLDLGLVLAAVGTLERFRRDEVPGWLRWGGPPILALGLAALHLWAYHALAHPAAPETLDVLRRGWVHWHLRFVVLGALVLVAGAGRRWTGPAVALLVAAELVLAHRPANPPMPPRLALPETPLVAHLSEAKERSAPAAGPGRMVGVDRAFLPNLPAVYGLHDARVFSPMTPAPYVRLLEPAIERWNGEIPALDGRDHPDLYDRLGVRWIVAAPEDGCPTDTETAFEGPDGLACRRPGAPAPATVDGAPPAALSLSAGGARWSIRIRESATSAGARRLETGVTRVPGWRVLADGRRAATEGQALLEAELPPDVRRVELLYRPAGFVAGMLSAALGLSALLAWVLPPPR